MYYIKKTIFVAGFSEANKCGGSNKACSTVVFWYEISRKFSAFELNYSQIDSSLSFRIGGRVRNILNSFA